MKRYSKKYWAKRAEKYDRINWVKNEEFLDTYLNMLPEKVFKKILEVGIGTGALGKIISDRIGPLIGIDISKEMISNIDHPNIEAILADVKSLPFNSETFDLIYMRNVLHYIDEPEKGFSEIYRCMKSNAYFLFSQVVSPDDSISEEYDWLVGRNIHYPTQTEIIDMFKDFSIIKRLEFLLEKQSITNWLNNTCNDKAKKIEIVQRHRDTSDHYKSLAQYEETSGDIFVNIKHMLVLGQKRLLSR